MRGAAVLIAMLLGCDERAPNPPFVPTAPDVMGVMFRLANVTAADVVYDLGCGDGRIVIMAVRQFGARGVCVDIDAERVAAAEQNARAAGVADRIRFVTADVLATDLHDATVVMMYLSRDLNLRLRPKLFALAPGARIVSHWHDLGDWKPTQAVKITSGGWERPVYLWTIPAEK